MSEEYPSDWDDVNKAKAEGSAFLKLKSGEEVQFQIAAGPLSFKQLGINGTDEKGKATFKTLQLPFGSQLPGYKLRASYAFEVVLPTGEHKMWVAGQKVAEQLAQIKEKWGSINKPALSLRREGEKLQTKWFVTPSPSNGDAPKPTLDLRELVVMATKEDLDRLPPPAQAKTNDSSLDQKLSAEQVKFISTLVDKKELTFEYVEKTVKRKFNKGGIEELNRSEASELIETLKAL